MLLVGTILLYSTVLCTADQPRTTVQQGVVRGLYSTTVGGRRYSTFLGIPYAKPPVGDLRFKKPISADSWIGVYNATKFPQKCLQLDHMLMDTPFFMQGSEDCLYLNVYTPRLMTEAIVEKPLDVIAFIHGGGFMFASSIAFGASAILDRDVVLVTFNYRLGPLGFLSTEDTAVPGNNGLKDQSLVLKWIQQNIAAFGGNPASVTISGFSAGGASVHYHLLSPLSKGLFKAAICASGTSLNPWAIAENSREKALFIGRQLGCPTEDSLSMIQCLRHRPAEHILDSIKHFWPWLYNPVVTYGPVVEPPGPDSFLPGWPINLIMDGKAADVPILFTYTKDEGLYPGAEIVSNPENLNNLKNRWNELLPHLLDFNYTLSSDEEKDAVSQKIKKHYRIDLDTEQGQQSLIKAISDRFYLHGISKTVTLHATIYTSPIYLYRFSYFGKHSVSTFFRGRSGLGVCHADDIIYIFPMKGVNTTETANDRAVSKEMVDLWVSFAAQETLDGETVGEYLPKIAFTDYQGPTQFVPMLVEELVEESFWNSLNFNENIENKIHIHYEM